MTKVKTKCWDENGVETECDIECEFETRELPKNKTGINISMNVNSADAEVIRESLKKAGHHKLAEDFETKREVGIMHDFWDCQREGIDIFEKWAKGDYYKDTRTPRYKRKHKILAK